MFVDFYCSVIKRNVHVWLGCTKRGIPALVQFCIGDLPMYTFFGTDPFLVKRDAKSKHSHAFGTPGFEICGKTSRDTIMGTSMMTLQCNLTFCEDFTTFSPLRSSEWCRVIVSCHI